MLQSFSLYSLLYILNSCWLRGIFCSKAVMTIVVALSAIGIGAAIFIPVDGKAIAQYTGLDEWANIYSYPIVYIRLPANRLLAQLLPAHIDIIRLFAFVNLFQFLLQLSGGDIASFRACNARLLLGLLRCNPRAEIGIDQPLKAGGIEAVIVDEGREAIAQAIPDMPDERAIVEELAVLCKKAVAQPEREAFARKACFSQ